MASARFVLVCLLFTSMISVATATPYSSIHHVVIREHHSRWNSTSLTPMHPTEITHAKRARQPVGNWGEQYALPHGWSVTVSTMSMFMIIGSHAAADWFDDFYWGLQVACATQMLNNGPCPPALVAIQGPWKFILGMHPHSTVQQIEWSFVYYFATYMRNWVQNGYTGTGAIMFKHTSGIKLVASFVNLEGRIGPVLY